MSITVDVEMPDGSVQAWPATYELSDDDYFSDHSMRSEIPSLRPIDREGWELRETIGAGPNWHAFKISR